MSEPCKGTSTLLLLIRHAEQRTLREIDAPLSDRGLMQAERLGERLAVLPISRIVTSPLLRARDTAAPLAQLTGIAPTIHEGLEEVRLPADHLRHMFSSTAARGMEPDVDDYASTTMASIAVSQTFTWGRTGEGETGLELRERLTSTIDRIVEEAGHGVVACISHGGAINAALAAWNGIEKDMWFVPWHTGVTGILFSGGARTLLFVNDATHLTRDEDILNVVTSSLKLE
jgi:broad specificity phosphatase PhoE